MRLLSHWNVLTFHQVHLTFMIYIYIYSYKKKFLHWSQDLHERGLFNSGLAPEKPVHDTCKKFLILWTDKYGIQQRQCRRNEKPYRIQKYETSADYKLLFLILFLELLCLYETVESRKSFYQKDLTYTDIIC